MALPNFTAYILGTCSHGQARCVCRAHYMPGVHHQQPGAVPWPGLFHFTYPYEPCDDPPLSVAEIQILEAYARERAEAAGELWAMQ